VDRERGLDTSFRQLRQGLTPEQLVKLIESELALDCRAIYDPGWEGTDIGLVACLRILLPLREQIRDLVWFPSQHWGSVPGKKPDRWSLIT